MKSIVVAATIGFALFAAQGAQAAGCVSGAAVGGVAGHVAGHHGVLGAAAGCAVGHHMAHKDAERANQQQMNSSQPDASAPR